MIVVKRYPNRKLYNTEAKRYVTLEGIAELIREGEEVQILDHTTGEDLTAVTLTQIIFEQEKKQSGFLPRSVLTGLVQSGGQTLGSLRRTLASPLDLFHQIDQEIEGRLQSLVDMGELSEAEGIQLREKLLSVGQNRKKSEMPSEEELARILSKHGVPTKDDLRQLNSRLDELVAKLDDLSLDESQPESHVGPRGDV